MHAGYVLPGMRPTSKSVHASAIHCYSMLDVACNSLASLPCSHILFSMFNSEQSKVSTQTQTEKAWLHPYSSHSCKLFFLFVASNCFPSPTFRLPNMDLGTQSGYKSADLLVFTHLAQKFASALNLRYSHRQQTTLSTI